MTSESELVSFEVLKKASSVQFEVAVAQMQFGEQNTGNWWEYILLGLEYDPNLKQEKDYFKRNDKRKEKNQKKEVYFCKLTNSAPPPFKHNRPKKFLKVSLSTNMFSFWLFNVHLLLEILWSFLFLKNLALLILHQNLEMKGRDQKSTNWQNKIP